jgi:hypothetical protein
MEDIVDKIFTTHKEKHLDTFQKHYVYQKTEKGIQINKKEVLLLKMKYLM